MHAKLRELQKVTQQIESQWRILVVQENSSKRDVWKRKVEQIVEDCDQFRVSLERSKSRENRRQAEERDRDELMQRVTSDDEFRLLVGQYDAEAGARSAHRERNAARTPQQETHNSLSPPKQQFPFSGLVV